MHLLDSYALTLGQPITRPFIHTKFFPLGVEKYITFQPYSRPSKSYDIWGDVIDELSPILAKKGISIIQIGQKDEKMIRGCYCCVGQTSIQQTSYIISNSLLHLGVDSFGAHVASGFSKKIVCLYSNNYLNAVKPYWTKPEDCILLEPDRTNRRPSFSMEEMPKTINEIKPESITVAVCKLLGLEYNNKYKSVYFGPFYTNKFIETVPNQILDISQFNVDSIVIRMDFLFNENMLAEQLKRCKCTIVTPSPINKDILSAFKPNIKELIYQIDKTTDVSFVETLQELNIIHHLITKEEGDDLNTVKLKFLDFGMITQKDVVNQQIVDKIKSESGQLMYKSSKVTLSSGKIYPCKSAFLKDKPVGSFDYQPIPIDDCDDFWKELECFKILLTKEEKPDIVNKI